MGRPKGIKKPPGSGRTAGTTNKITQYRQTIEEKCQSKGIDIWDAMLECLSEATDAPMKFNMLKEMAQYVYSKKRSLEVDANVNLEVVKEVQEMESKTSEELKAIIQEEMKRLK